MSMFVRKLPAIIAAAGLLVSLSACSGSPVAGGCTPEYASGSNSALVTANGTLGSDPKATFPTPLVATSTEVSVPIPGSGRLVNHTDTAVLQITVYDGKSGTGIVTTTGSDSGLPQLALRGAPIFGAMAQCSKVGARIAAVGTALDVLGEAILKNLNTQFTSNGAPTLANSDTLVIIADVRAQYLGRANGADRAPQPGLPSIVLAPNGQPGFTFPAGNAPSELKISMLKQGSGTAVQKGDSVVINYSGVEWAAKAAFDTTTWDNKRPAIWLATGLDEDPKGIIKGLAQALIGAKVGSQILVVVPPSDGYPAGSEPTGVTAGSTLTYVVDVLGIQGK